MLCASGIWQLQWALMLVGFAVSGAVLATSLWSALSEDQRKTALAVTAVVLLLHLALAAGFLVSLHFQKHTGGRESVVL